MYQQNGIDSSKSLCCYYHLDYMNNVFPTDAWEGDQVKHWFGVGLNYWILVNKNVAWWESGKFPTWRNRVIINHVLK